MSGLQLWIAMGSSRDTVQQAGDPVVVSEGSRPAVSHELRIVGSHGEYAGQTVDLSRTGALLWITDERFDAQDFMLFSERVYDEFGKGMRIFVGDVELPKAEVARVTRKGDEGGPGDPGICLVACRFERSLTPDESRELGVDAEERSGRERRRMPRVDRVYVAEIQSDGGTYRAHVLNLSCSGALFTLLGAAFAPPADPDRLAGFTRRVGLQFSSGLMVRILDGDVAAQADVVRVMHKTDEGDPLIVVGCRFRRVLTPQECDRLDIESSPAPGPAKANPYAGRSEIRMLMAKAMECGASDLHVKVDSPPRLRLRGRLIDVGKAPIKPEEAHAMALELMTPEQATRFELEGDVELAASIEGVGRYRVNILRQRGMTGIAARCIPSDIPTIEGIGLSPYCRILAERPRGLVLCTGPTGSGKSTTLAAIVNHLNVTRPCHIITMEDPIEYIHTDLEAHITQREIGRDALDFKTALKRALRQDPDVIMVGEMRDLETIALALTAAETGHLVFATLHTTSAVQTAGRIVDVFPPGQQTQIRTQLSESLQGIMAQQLLPSLDGGMALAQEILVATDAVRSLIREGKAHQILNLMQTGVKDGMLTLETSLNRLVEEGVISYEIALAKSHFPKQIRRPKKD